MYEGRRNLIVFVLALLVDMNAKYVVMPILKLFIDPESTIIITLCGAIDALLGCLVIFLAIKIKYIKPICMDFIAVKFRIVIKGLVYCLGATILANILGLFMCNFYDMGVIFLSNVNSDNYLLSISEKIVYLIYACIVVPLNEELIFRGVLIRAFSNALGVKIAILLSSLVFGLLHGVSFVVIVNAILGGIAFGYVYTKTDNLMYTMLIHGMINCIAVLKSYGL